MVSMKQYIISEATLRSFIEESLLLECLMESDPPLEEIKAHVRQQEGCSWDELVDTNFQRFVEARCAEIGS